MNVTTMTFFLSGDLTGLCLYIHTYSIVQKWHKENPEQVNGDYLDVLALLDTESVL